MSSADEPKGKIGDGHAAAMGRQGLNEMRAALYPGSNVAQQPEYGLYGTRTQGEIAKDRKPKAQEHNDEQSLYGPEMSDQQEMEVDREDDRELEHGL